MERHNPAAPLRVLVVDDCPDTTWSMTLLLRAWGHDTCVAADGLTALGQVDAFRPEVVLLDIGLPGLNGLEVARRLRLRPASSRPLVIAVSGFGRAEDCRLALDAGCDLYLIKPVQPEILRQLLDRAKQGGVHAQPPDITAGGVSRSFSGG
jgi:DNA-binding response OmpR family regulator